MRTRILTSLFPLVAVPALLLALGARPAAAAGSVRVLVSPNVLLADGVSTATVTAEVRNSSGRPARDGTEVRFYTTAGTITQVAFTSAGIARATLTASAVPQAANISVSAGIEQSVLTVPMVSKLVEANVGGRVLNVRAKYVAFSEDKRFIQADEQVIVRYRGVEIQANSVQIDMNQDTVKALGKISISSDDQSLVGERLWLSLKTFEGYIMAVGVKKWFSAYGLTDLPEKPKNIDADFELVDLTDSKLLWVASQANYIVGERVQVQGARAYVSGIKSMRMPFHEANLQGGFGETSQYVGIGTEGITLDMPFYVSLKPDASTAFHVGYGARHGLGYASRTDGLSVDLVQKYGFRGTMEGEARVLNMTSLDRWGFYWNHNQQLNKRTRLVANLQFPEHRDLYGSFNLTSGMPFGTVHMAMAANRIKKVGSFGKTLSFGFESKPRPVADGKLNVSVSASYYTRDAQRVRLARGLKLPVDASQQTAFGLNLRPKSVDLGHGFTLDSNVALRAVTGGYNAGFGPGLETNIRKTLPNNGYLTLGLNYNALQAVSDLLPQVGKLNATASLSYPITKKLRIAAFGTAALDAQSRNSVLQASYQISQSWRLDLLHTFYKYGQFGDFDYELGIARAIGNRELSLYWSRREHKWIVEFGAGRF